MVCQWCLPCHFSLQATTRRCVATPSHVPFLRAAAPPHAPPCRQPLPGDRPPALRPLLVGRQRIARGHHQERLHPPAPVVVELKRPQLLLLAVLPRGGRQRTGQPL